MSHVLANDLREAVLQAAIQGKLSSKNDKDTPIVDTLKIMQENRNNLFKNKFAKPSKPTHEVNDIELFDIPTHWVWEELSNIGPLTRGRGIKKTEVVANGFPCVRYGQLYTKYKTKFSSAVSFVEKD